MRPEAAFKLFLLVLILAVPLALAQKTNANRVKYDVSKEVKLKGAVESVKTVPAPKGEPAIELLIKTADETVEVRLCPERVLEEFEVKYASGDQVEITGARTTMDDKQVVLAREVVRGVGYWPVTVTVRLTV
jgi:hypothetical protein